ncbi:MAG: alpha/beta fold hydrolase [Gemmataceae bacterium]
MSRGRGPPCDCSASPAGRGASAYRGWQDRLPGCVEVWPVQLPGREARIGEPAFDRIDPLVEAVAAAVGPHLDRPYAVFGHSLGAVVGFEVARRLRQLAGKEPAHLFVCGYNAPGSPRRRSRRSPISRPPTSRPPSGGSGGRPRRCWRTTR